MRAVAGAGQLSSMPPVRLPVIKLMCSLTLCCASCRSGWDVNQVACQTYLTIVGIHRASSSVGMACHCTLSLCWSGWRFHESYQHLAHHNRWTDRTFVKSS